MTKLLNSKIRLEIHEPWEQSEILLGQIVDIHNDLPEIYFIIKIHKKHGLYKVSARYFEENLLDISIDNKIHVAVGYTAQELMGELLIFKYFGRGSVILLPD